jgi:hypothetical protein
MGQVSREVMMDGLPVDMAEEHVSYENQWPDQAFEYLRCRGQMLTMRSFMSK